MRWFDRFRTRLRLLFRRDAAASRMHDAIRFHDKNTPFHRFGVRMNKKLETTRDRRLTREEEKRLLDTALEKMNDGEHQFAGPLLQDRIIGAIEIVCRRGEMIQQTQRYLERDGRGTQTGTGGELETRRPTTSTRVRSLKLIGQWACAVATNLSPTGLVVLDGYTSCSRSYPRHAYV
jgi:hypothetical protein